MKVLRLVFFFWALSLITAARVEAQPADAGEEFLIHLDKAFYVGGEIIWHKIYLPQEYRGYDPALKIALWDPAGQVVGDYFVKTGGTGTMDGFFKLPYGLPSGNYHLLVLGTLQSTKRQIKLAETFIPVYNDLDTEIEKLEPSPDPPAAAEPAKNDLQISISLEGRPFQKREEIKALVAVTDGSGRPVAADISISVIDSDLTGGGLGQLNIFKVEPAGRPISPAELDNNLYVYGRVTDLEGTPRSELLFGAFDSQEYRSFFSTSASGGTFALALPDFRGEKTLQLTALRDNNLQGEIADEVALAPAPPLPFTESVKQYLQWSRSRKMIYQLYNSVEASLQIRPVSVNKRQLKPDQRIILKEYASFPELYTFFTEVSTPLKLRQDKEGGYNALMFDPDPRVRLFYQGSPIFIVDGKMTKEVNFIQNLDLEKIDTIDLYFDHNHLNEFFGKMGNSGIAVFKTSIPNLQLPAADEANIHIINGMLPESSRRSVAAPSSDHPVFRPQLFWGPDLSTGADGQVPFSFTQSDDLGTFRVEVVAKTKDGRMGYGRKNYQVQW